MMNDFEFRADLLATAAARAEERGLSPRPGFVTEMLDRLGEAGEVPDAELCAEAVEGKSKRQIEIDAFAFDEADESLHLFIAVLAGGDTMPDAIALTEARDRGFNRLQGVYDQAEWLRANVEESRPIWALAQRICRGSSPSALRLHVLTDRPISERLREIPASSARDGLRVEFQIWDVTRLKRILEARSVRDDLSIDFTSLPSGGLTALPAASAGDYVAYLTVVPGEMLAEIYIKEGSRLLEGNVRTFLGRRGRVNAGIASTLSSQPERFFAYNNGIAATASRVRVAESAAGTVLITGIDDLQIVNGAQTTASLASLRREGKLPEGLVAVPMKLSIVEPSVSEELIQSISRCSNSQNSIRDSDFFANHPFHRRMEEISRRILAPAQSGSLTQTHWYYERARGQYLHDKAALVGAKKNQFERLNPPAQVIKKTDLAKVETSFNIDPDVACKGAEKAFTSFAERITEDWKDEAKRSTYSDDWYRSAVARTVLFRATERLVSKATWYEGGYRAQVVAYTLARLAHLAAQAPDGGRLDFLKVWVAQAAGEVLESQLLAIAEVMMGVLRSPPLAGQNVSEWAKHQACKRQAMAATVPIVKGFDAFVVGMSGVRAREREERERQRVTDGLSALTEVLQVGAPFWRSLREFATARRLPTADDEAALLTACAMPRRVPADWQAPRLLAVKRRCEEAGFLS